jgi:Fe-S cluster assembly protein SufD
MSVTLLKTAAETDFTTRYATFRAHKGGANAFVRDAAFARFQEKGLPHRRIEAWHYTDLRSKMTHVASVENEVALDIPAAPLALRLPVDRVIVNSVPQNNGDARIGLTITSLDGAPAASIDDAAVLLNTAFASGGYRIHIATGASVELHLHHVFGGDALAASVCLIELEPGAHLTLLESVTGDESAYQANTRVDITLHSDARLDHVRFVAHGEKAQSIHSMFLNLETHAVATSTTLTYSGALNRTQVFSRFAGEYAKLNLNGITLGKDSEHADSTLVVTHAAPHGESRETYKHILKDRAVGVFQGKICVEPQAQKTDGRMMCGAVLLSDTATLNAKPELEIFADDVQCAHGATCGALDEDLLFYLRARGLPRVEAEALLLQAFVGDALKDIDDAATHDLLMGAVVDWLRG